MQFEDTPMFCVSSCLMQMLVHAGIKADDAIAHFIQVYKRAELCPPNYNYFGHKANAWIVRDFFPNTGIFFKLTIAKRPHPGEENQIQTIVKVKVPETMGTSKSGHMYVNYDSYMKLLDSKAERELLGDGVEIHEVFTKKLRKPRAMFPKGFK